MKYLTESQTKSQLVAGRAVEQMLGHEVHPNYRSLSWVRIEPEPDGLYSVVKFDVFDDGSPDYLDIYSFEPLDPDNSYGVIQSVKTAEEALEFASENYATRPVAWVGQGMIQDVYSVFLEEHGVFEPSN